MLYLGCDVHKKMTVVSFIGEDGKVLGTRKFCNNMTESKLGDLGKNHRGHREKHKYSFCALISIYPSVSSVVNRFS